MFNERPEWLTIREHYLDLPDVWRRYTILELPEARLDLPFGTDLPEAVRAWVKDIHNYLDRQYPVGDTFFQMEKHLRPEYWLAGEYRDN